MYGRIINICQYYNEVIYPGETFLIADEKRQEEWLDNRRKKGKLIIDDIIAELNDGGCVGFLKGTWRLICPEDWESLDSN